MKAMGAKGVAVVAALALALAGAANAQDATAQAVQALPDELACAAALEAGRAELVGALGPCVVSQGASDLCCEALSGAFGLNNTRFGGCLCYSAILAGVVAEAGAFLPGQDDLIRSSLQGCAAPLTEGGYAAALPFDGLGSGPETCEKHPRYDILLGGMPQSNLPATSEGQVLEALAILTAEKCGSNLASNRTAIVNTLGPCIISAGPSQSCCGALEATFRPSNPDFGGCLCHSEVLDGIIVEAEQFLPAAGDLVTRILGECTAEYGSEFPFASQGVAQATGELVCPGDAQTRAVLDEPAADPGDADDGSGRAQRLAAGAGLGAAALLGALLLA